MKQWVTMAAALALMTAPLRADVTMTSQVTGEGLAKMAEGQSVTYIKGLKMRTDSNVGGSSRTTLFDVEAQRMVSIDHGKKEAEVWDLAAFRRDMGQAVKAAPAASVTPNGQTREIAGQQCDGYDMSISMGMAAGPDPSLTMVMSGPVFIAKGAPGSEDLKQFYLAAAERGFIMSDPKSAKAAPQQAQGMTELYRKIAEIGGVPYSMEMSMKVEGGGPMAGMMSKMLGNSKFVNTVVSVTTEDVSADMFEIPDGYQVNKK
jgi:hypothetical protein